MKSAMEVVLALATKMTSIVEVATEVEEATEVATKMTAKRTTAENKVILLYLTLWVRFHLPTL